MEHDLKRFNKLDNEARGIFENAGRHVFENPGKVDEGLWAKAKRAAEHAGADNKYAFTTWWYLHHGGSFK
jgi:hypothetical protein